MEEKPLTRTELRWEGATAEQLADTIEAVAPGFSLAVIRDEEAVVYHHATIEEVGSELAAASSVRPEHGFSVSESVKAEEPIVPESRAETRTTISIDPDNLRQFGLTAQDVGESIEKFNRSSNVEPTSPESCEEAFIPMPDGTRLALREIAEIVPRTVTRPIIMDRR